MSDAAHGAFLSQGPAGPADHVPSIEVVAESAPRRHTFATRLAEDGPMLHLEMSNAGECAVITLTGVMSRPDHARAMADALDFVPADDHVVVDLRLVDRLAPECASDLCTRLLDRVAWSEAVVVSDRPDVTLTLVLGEVDRVVPIVATVRQAVNVVRARVGSALQGDDVAVRDSTMPLTHLDVRAEVA